MIKHISSKIENPTRSFPLRVKIHFHYKYMLSVYSAQPKRLFICICLLNYHPDLYVARKLQLRLKHLSFPFFVKGLFILRETLINVRYLSFIFRKGCEQVATWRTWLLYRGSQQSKNSAIFHHFCALPLI